MPEPDPDARTEVQVGHEPPAAPPPTAAVRPRLGQRALWAVGAAAAALVALWVLRELIDAPRLLNLAPLVAASAAVGVVSGRVHDPVGRLTLAVLVTAGVITTAILFEAPIFGLLIAAIIFLPAVNRVINLTGRVSALLRPVRKGISEQVVQPIGEWTQPRRRVVLPLIGIVVITMFALLPFLNDWFEVPDWVAAATSGGTLSRLGLFCLFALGLNVVVGYAGLLDLGYVAFWAIGSYTAAILTGAAAYTRGLKADVLTSADRPVWDQWMWLILLAALAMAVLAGVVLGSPTLRLRGDYLAIVTLGFGEIIRIVANNLDPITGGPQGISSIPHPAVPVPGGGRENDIQLGTLVDVKYYWLLLVLVVLWVIAIRLLDHSRIGRAWVAIREDEVAAAAMGIPVVKMKLAAFVIGASTAGVGGVIYAEQANFINPGSFDILNSILILCCVVIGGMGAIAGSILGAAAIIILPEVFREFNEYRIFAFGVALVIVMIFRPQGILPSKRRKRELKGGVVEEQLYEVQVAAGSGGGGS